MLNITIDVNGSVIAEYRILNIGAPHCKGPQPADLRRYAIEANFAGDELRPPHRQRGYVDHCRGEGATALARKVLEAFP